MHRRLLFGFLASLSCAAAAQMTTQAVLTFADGRIDTFEIVEQTFLEQSRRTLVVQPDGTSQAIPASETASLIQADGETFIQVRASALGPEGRSTSVERLARRLVAGSANLYELHLRPAEQLDSRQYDGGKLYYLGLAGQEPVELAGRFAYVGTNKRFVDSYVSTLQFLLKACPELESRLHRRGIDYRAADLRRLVREYNACVGDDPAADALPPKTKTTTRFSIGGGYLLANEFKEHPAFHGYMVRATAGLAAPRISERVVGRIGLEYAEYNVNFSTRSLGLCLQATENGGSCNSRGDEYDIEYDEHVWLIPLSIQYDLGAYEATVRPYFETGLTIFKPADNTWLPAFRLGGGVTKGRWRAFAVGEIGGLRPADDQYASSRGVLGILFRVAQVGDRR